MKKNSMKKIFILSLEIIAIIGLIYWGIIYSSKENIRYVCTKYMTLANANSEVCYCISQKASQSLSITKKIDMILDHKDKKVLMELVIPYFKICMLERFMDHLYNS